MPLPLTGLVGPAVAADGATPPLRQGKTGEVVVTELHGKYYEQAARGQLFHATVDTAGVALAAAGTTAGFALYNPLGSGKNLEIVRVALAIVSGTYVVGGVMHGVNTVPQAAAVTGTALTSVAGMAGSQATSVGKAFKTATLPVAQTALRPFVSKNTAAPFQILSEDVDGQIVLAPGTAWSLFIFGADTTPLEVASVTWGEIAA
ncbi:MAG: hypothetical protein KGJ86_13250 [Chloroflexota bacterium]|nr:hypothetical protein [Chloroflexota bacterium]